MVQVIAQIVFNVGLNLKAPFSLGTRLYGSMHPFNTEAVINNAAAGTHRHTHSHTQGQKGSVPVCVCVSLNRQE